MCKVVGSVTGAPTGALAGDPELLALLAAGSRAALATVRRDGRPQLSTVDYTLAPAPPTPDLAPPTPDLTPPTPDPAPARDPGTPVTGNRPVVRISTTAGRAKVANLRRDPRAVLYVAAPGGVAWVAADALATVTPAAAEPFDPVVEELVEVYRAIQGEHPDWADYRAAMVADRRLVIRLAVQRVYGWAGG